MSVAIPRQALRALWLLETNGFPAYIVGGSLRDALLGLPPHDWDVTTPALPDQMMEIFTAAGHATIPTGMAHGTVTVLVDHSPVECTTYRLDGDYTDARHPDSVRFTDRISDDLARRDFTVNAMACRLPHIAKWDAKDPRLSEGMTLSVEELDVVDLYGGRADLHAHIIRCVGDPVTRLTEDALRILRGVRFCVQLSSTPDPATEAALHTCRGGLARISVERIAAELISLLTCGRPAAEGLSLMSRTGLWEYVLPEFKNNNITKYFKNESELFFALDRLPSDAALRLSLLLSGTDEAAAKQACRRLKLSNRLTDAVSAMVGSLDLSCPATEADVRRRMVRLGEHAEGALTLGRMCRPDRAADYEKALDRMKVIGARGDCLTLRDLAVDGKTLMDELGLGGRAVGAMLATLLDAVLDDPALNDRATLLSLARVAEKR